MERWRSQGAEEEREEQEETEEGGGGKELTQGPGDIGAE